MDNYTSLILPITGFLVINEEVNPLMLSESNICSIYIIYVKIVLSLSIYISNNFMQSTIDGQLGGIKIKSTFYRIF